MSDSKDSPKAKEVGDKELDDLLNSALQDMTKPLPTQSDSVAAPASGEVNLPPNLGPESMWSDEFIREAAKQFENNMASLLGNVNGVGADEQISQDQIAATFQKMAEAAAQVMKPLASNSEGGNSDTQEPPLQVDNEITAAITQTLQSLNSNTDNLQTPFSDQDLANMFANFNMDGQEGENMFVPFMQGMMQSLLSKEVLYPSLKELMDKYPKWFEDNKEKVEAAEMERYRKQYDLIVSVCNELEKETDDDSDEVRKDRFTAVLEKMQQMQDLGQPPAELAGEIGEMPTGLIPPNTIEGGAENPQCCVM